MTIQQCKYVLEIARTGSFNEAAKTLFIAQSSLSAGVVEQSNFILGKYISGKAGSKLYIATQHYDFVADIFGKMINAITDNAYKIALKETQTYDVINRVEKGYCDIGIIALKSTGYDIMKRVLQNEKLDFPFILKAKPHVFIRKGHVLSKHSVLTMQFIDMLKNFH